VGRCVPDSTDSGQGQIAGSSGSIRGGEFLD
jgi:hypothetical protein